MSKVILLELENNSNIGMFMFVNDKFCILGKEVKDKILEQIEEILEVPIYKTTALSTELIGVFVAGNNEILLLPELYEYEMKVFEEIAQTHNMELIVVSEKQNTFGNTICFGNKEIIANASFSKSFIEKLSKETKLNVIALDSKEYNCAGAIVKSLNGKYFISQELEEQQVQEFLNNIADIGTVNGGSNYVSSGIVGNKNGLLLGSHSTTIEIQKIVEAFNYI